MDVWSPATVFYVLRSAEDNLPPPDTEAREFREVLSLHGWIYIGFRSMEVVVLAASLGKLASVLFFAYIYFFFIVILATPAVKTGNADFDTLICILDSY